MIKVENTGKKLTIKGNGRTAEKFLEHKKKLMLNPKAKVTDDEISFLEKWTAKQIAKGRVSAGETETETPKPLKPFDIKATIETPESVKPSVIKATPAPSLTEEQLAAAVASLTDEQIEAAAHLMFATNNEIRDEFQTEARYVAFIKAKMKGKFKIATGQGVKTYPKPKD